MPSAQRLVPGAEIFTLSDTGGQRAGSGRSAPLWPGGRARRARSTGVARPEWPQRGAAHLETPGGQRGFAPDGSLFCRRWQRGEKSAGPCPLTVVRSGAQISLAGLAANGAGRARCASWAPPFSRLSHRGPHKAQRGALRCFVLEDRRRGGARRGKTLNRSLLAAASSGAAEGLLCAPCAESGGGHAGRVTLPTQHPAPSTKH